MMAQFTSGKRAVRADHCDGMIFFFFAEAHCFGVAQFLRQRLDLADEIRFVAEIFARHKILCVGMRDDMTIVVDDENASASHAIILQAMQNRIKRNHRSQHTREIVVGVFQRHGNNKCRPVIRGQRQRITAKFDRLRATAERPLQSLGDEGISLRMEISLGSAGAFAVAADGGQVNKRVAVGIDEIFQ